MPFVVVVVVLAKSLMLYINIGSCARNLGSVQTYPLFLKNDFLKDWPFVHNRKWLFFELANSEHDLISSRGLFYDRAPVFKIDALKGVDTERTTGETSEALTLTYVAGAGLVLRANEEQKKKLKK